MGEAGHGASGTPFSGNNGSGNNGSGKNGRGKDAQYPQRGRRGKAERFGRWEIQRIDGDRRSTARMHSHKWRVCK